MLVHSSVSGRRQWRSLTASLQDRYCVVALDLIGYGDAPAWTASRPQRLSDQADALLEITAEVGEPRAIVGHSFGGSVAICAAAALGDRLRQLVLLEPNPFSITRDANPAAYAEAAGLRDVVQTCGDRGAWSEAAERFADYWNGPGTWETMPPERRAAFASLLAPNYHEWDAVMSAPMTTLLPTVTATTHVIAARDTARSITAVVEALALVRPDWHYSWIPQGGHMAPLTAPDVVNPLVSAALDEVPDDVLDDAASGR